MLQKLFIQNYALIKKLEMRPSEGLSIITGETGAGKSIMLGALGLLLGNRADSKALLDTSTKCIIEGIFNIGEYNLDWFFDEFDLDHAQETTIRREITPAGKSRAFVNDTPLNLDSLKILGSYLMDVHSQNETLLLAAKKYQLNLLDSYAGSLPLAKQVNQLYLHFMQEEKEHQRLIAKGEQLKQEEDYTHFLLQELSSLNLQSNEQEILEKELKILENAEKIKTNLNEILQLLSSENQGVMEQLQVARSTLQELQPFGENFKALYNQLERVFIELKELERDVFNEEEQVEIDFNQTEKLQQRLSAIYQLQSKHKVGSINALLEIQQELESKMLASQNLEEDIATAKNKSNSALKKAEAKAEELSIKRRKEAAIFSKQIESTLAQVGIPEGKLTIEVQPTDLSASGIDHVVFNFSANKGVAAQPLKQVASGGEFSRLMFCIKYLLAGKASLPTIVFDEIDTGISGEIALKMGAMMQKMAKRHQVVAISHLPQIAAKANKHYFVYKDNTSAQAVSAIKALTHQESIETIAKMIGGDSPSSNAYASAKELMKST